MEIEIHKVYPISNPPKYNTLPSTSFSSTPFVIINDVIERQSTFKQLYLTYTM